MTCFKITSHFFLLRPPRYRAYLQNKTPVTPRGKKYSSPLWYLYSPNIPKIERDAQLAELRYVEQQLGIKFWKVKVDSEKKERFLKSLAEASEPPPDNKLPRRFREEASPSPATPFFYNLYVSYCLSNLTTLDAGSKARVIS